MKDSITPSKPDDKDLCQNQNCGRPFSDHGALDTDFCPHPDGNGFLMGQWFKHSVLVWDRPTSKWINPSASKPDATPSKEAKHTPMWKAETHFEDNIKNVMTFRNGEDYIIVGIRDPELIKQIAKAVNDAQEVEDLRKEVIQFESERDLAVKALNKSIDERGFKAEKERDQLRANEELLKTSLQVLTKAGEMNLVIQGQLRERNRVLEEALIAARKSLRLFAGTNAPPSAYAEITAVLSRNESKIPNEE